LLLGLYGTASGSMVEGLSVSTLVGAAIGVGIAFIFMLVAEILLAKRKKAGVVLFLLGYLTTIVNAALSLLKEQTAFAVVSLVIAVVVGLLVFIYYHKRSNLFT
jgi:lipoprotein signal peptidase